MNIIGIISCFQCLWIFRKSYEWYIIVMTIMKKTSQSIVGFLHPAKNTHSPPNEKKKEMVKKQRKLEEQKKWGGGGGGGGGRHRKQN